MQCISPPIFGGVLIYGKTCYIFDMTPSYGLDRIKFGTDRATFERAVNLYEKDKITNFKDEYAGFSAIVLGSHPYHVFVSNSHYEEGDCDCYLGQNNTLCKHMVALAIRAVTGNKQLSTSDKEFIDRPICSGILGVLDKEEIQKVKKSITSAMRYIKSYSGHSRTWFAYQDSLSLGCRHLSAIISRLPVNLKTAEMLVDLLLRLDDKLCRSGVDDSDGTVGTFMEETVQVLKEYAKLDSSCLEAFNELKDKETCFGWEEPLLKLLN